MNVKKVRGSNVYEEESFDTIFNMGYGGGEQRHAPPPGLLVGKIAHGREG